ncbi:hypothetical protein OAB57_03315, partial [Bacteriovoracaceae bacterium]|nr:hypothetical protein [Bacteriovoracaceae bacterium]
SNAKYIVLASLFLCTFREEFPFALIAVFPVFLYQRSFKTGLIVFAIGIAFSYFNFFIRGEMMGALHDHGSGKLHDLIAQPLEVLWQSWKQFSLGHLKIFYPFIPFLLLMKDVRKSPLVIVSMALLPLFLIRFLFNQFAFHYSACLLGAFFAVIVIDAPLEKIFSNKKTVIISLLLFVLSSSSIWNKQLKLLFWNSSPKCTINQQKQIQTNEVLTIIDTKVGPKETIIATGGIVPRLIVPGRKVYHLGSLGIKQSRYDYLLIERHNSGDIWPLTLKDTQIVEKDCLTSANTLYSSEYYLLLKDIETEHCLNKDRYFPVSKTIL